MSNLLKSFNDHFEDFFVFIQETFPEDKDILSAKNSVFALRKANPRLIPTVWLTYLVGPYIDRIQAGDISFFVNKDYTQDIFLPNAKKIVTVIDRLREPIKQMSFDNQTRAIKYIQTLSKLSIMLAQ